MLLVLNLWISGPLVLIFSMTNTDKSYLLYILFTVGNLLQASQSINLSNSEREINPLKQTKYPLGLMIQVMHSVLSFSRELIWSVYFCVKENWSLTDIIITMLENVKVNSRSNIRFFMHIEFSVYIWQVNFESIYFDLAIS